MRFTIALIAACFMWAGTAFACEVKEWDQSYDDYSGFLRIYGVATCSFGVLGIRIYDSEGEGRKLVGVNTAIVQAHVFDTSLPVRDLERVEALSIKFGPGS